MPRNRPGGMRNGAPGTPYPNRTDLNKQPSLPARVATDQTYGKATAQLQAQRTVPMAPPPTVMAPPGGAASPLVPQPGVPQMAPPGPEPGSFGPLDRFTERPGEPITHGAPFGPGAGPEVLPQGPAVPASGNLSSLLNQIAQTSGSPVIAAMAAHAAANGV